jgi:hypothetical protein
MRIKTPKQWYTLFWCVLLGGPALLFVLNGVSKGTIAAAAFIAYLSLSLLNTGYQQKRADEEDAEERNRKQSIADYALKMDEAMRWGFAATRHADVWDDGDKFNPTIYGEYVAGEKKYLVRSYTLWGKMTVYEHVKSGVVVQKMKSELETETVK